MTAALYTASPTVTVWQTLRAHRNGARALGILHMQSMSLSRIGLHNDNQHPTLFKLEADWCSCLSLLQMSSLLLCQSCLVYRLLAEAGMSSARR